MSGSYLDWQVGDKVVCVDSVWHGNPASGHPCPLVAGEVYTIASIGSGTGFYRSFVRGILIDLVEVKNPDAPYIDTAGFCAERFRKVQPRKTSIAILERFLNDANAPIREEA